MQQITLHNGGRRAGRTHESYTDILKELETKGSAVCCSSSVGILEQMFQNSGITVVIESTGLKGFYWVETVNEMLKGFKD